MTTVVSVMQQWEEERTYVYLFVYVACIYARVQYLLPMVSDEEERRGGGISHERNSDLARILVTLFSYGAAQRYDKRSHKFVACNT